MREQERDREREEQGRKTCKLDFSNIFLAMGGNQETLFPRSMPLSVPRPLSLSLSFSLSLSLSFSLSLSLCLSLSLSLSLCFSQSLSCSRPSFSSSTSTRRTACKRKTGREVKRASRWKKKQRDSGEKRGEQGRKTCKLPPSLLSSCLSV